jgi:crotonobetainyl-CoA:carnitine CoA-transferase CaiB-like acyl-CoA transferase
MNTNRTTTKPTAAVDGITPLDGIHVVTIALNLPGPAAARRLADLGANVVKVEPPSGDPMQSYSGSYYAELHAGIDVQRIDLKSTTGIASFSVLLSAADILITAQRRGALQRLGLSPEALAAQYPMLCHVALYGDASGETAGHDLTYLAEAGLLTPPSLPRTLLADLVAAERAVQAVFAALRLRDRFGRGHAQEVYLTDAAHTFAKPFHHRMTQPGDIIGGGHPGYNFYPAEDGWIALAALEPHFIARIETLLDIRLTHAALKAVFQTRPLAYWRQWAATHDIPLAVVSA